MNPIAELKKMPKGEPIGADALAGFAERARCCSRPICERCLTAPSAPAAVRSGNGATPSK